ncbi:hypothetical protein [Pantoea sp. SORGH_AS_0659]|uniref:hypothetical protein n=1 Tax=Pantoea sp. SORGH_AS_0659 TaxID=3062597 RepID=UPI002863F3C9|nr:hypothetical protein [Pantoea sp. SORGH_AS_0659]MDR6352533.1 hypothetical protein [Pantoea sp. SORGH_AS_0659]
MTIGLDHSFNNTLNHISSTANNFVNVTEKDLSRNITFARNAAVEPQYLAPSASLKPSAKESLTKGLMLQSGLPATRTEEVDKLSAGKQSLVSRCVKASAIGKKSSTSTQARIESMLLGHDLSLKANTNLQGSDKLVNWIDESKNTLSNISDNCRNLLNKLEEHKKKNMPFFLQERCNELYSRVALCPEFFNKTNIDKIEKLLNMHVNLLNSGPEKTNELDKKISNAMPAITLIGFEKKVTSVLSDVYNQVKLPDLSRLNIDTRGKFGIFDDAVKAFMSPVEKSINASDMLSRIAEIYSFFENLASDPQPEPATRPENTVQKQEPVRRAPVTESPNFSPAINISLPKIEVNTNNHLSPATVHSELNHQADDAGQKDVKRSSSHKLNEIPKGVESDSSTVDEKGERQAKKERDNAVKVKSATLKQMTTTEDARPPVNKDSALTKPEPVSPNKPDLFLHKVDSSDAIKKTRKNMQTETSSSIPPATREKFIHVPDKNVRRDLSGSNKRENQDVEYPYNMYSSSGIQKSYGVKQASSTNTSEVYLTVSKFQSQFPGKPVPSQPRTLAPIKHQSNN